MILLICKNTELKNGILFFTFVDDILLNNHRSDMLSPLQSGDVLLNDVLLRDGIATPIVVK